jgi:hypothetical protein
LFSAHILPPWASTILFEIYNPKPVPLKDFVANFVNSLGNISGSIPTPVSFILTIISFWLLSLLLFFFISIAVSASATVIDILPPSSLVKIENNLTYPHLVSFYNKSIIPL